MIHGNIAKCENLSKAIKNEELDERLKTSITQHLQSLETEFKRYFPEPKKQKAAFVRNPFSTALDELQDQFCDLQNDSSAHDALSEIAISQFGVLCTGLSFRAYF